VRQVDQASTLWKPDVKALYLTRNAEGCIYKPDLMAAKRKARAIVGYQTWWLAETDTRATVAAGLGLAEHIMHEASISQ
jgi:hypothetical protein